mgnify:FL=1
MFGPQYVYEQIERPLIKPLSQIMGRGVGVQKERLRALEADLGNEVEERKAIWKEMSGGIKYGSWKKAGEFLVRSGVPLHTKTETGSYAVDADTLEEFQHYPEVAARLAIAEVENLHKLAVGYLESVRPDGRIYCQINSVGTETGRMSCFDPNLAQVPKETGEEDTARYKWGLEFRKCFVPAPGHIWFHGDYNAMEMRMQANLSGDRIYIELFRADGDPHLDTEQRVFGTQRVHRRESKIINFGLMYLEGARKLASQTGMTIEAARKAITTYFLEHKELKNWQDQEIEKAKLRGYVDDYVGRRRYVRIWKESTPREVVNMPIQGTCAEILKLAIIKLQDSPLVLPVHDELNWEVEEGKDLKKVAAEYKYTMENIMRFPVIMKVDMSWGPSWGEQTNV